MTERIGVEGASKPRMSWLTIFVSGLVTLVVSVAAGTVIYGLQSREPHLVYSTSDTLPFNGENRVVAVYQVSLTNDGKRSVDEVVCVIRIPGAAIEQKRVIADPSLSYTDSTLNDTLKLQISSLNPSETVHVSVLASAPSFIPTHPEVSLRAKGVLGEQTSSKGDQRPFLVGFTTSLAAVAVSFVFFIVSVGRLKRQTRSKAVTEGEEGRHSDDQRQILAYLHRLHGLSTEAERLLSQSHATSYWAEADRMGQLAVHAQNEEIRDKYKSVLSALLEYAVVSKSSQAIIRYNLARIALASNQTSEASARLKEASALSPKLIARRIHLDPLFKGNEWQGIALIGSADL